MGELDLYVRGNPTCRLCRRTDSFCVPDVRFYRSQSGDTSVECRALCRNGARKQLDVEAELGGDLLLMRLRDLRQQHVDLGI